jgi:predicted nucleic-acid-binding protein
VKTENQLELTKKSNQELGNNELIVIEENNMIIDCHRSYFAQKAKFQRSRYYKVYSNNRRLKEIV